MTLTSTHDTSPMSKFSLSLISKAGVWNLDQNLKPRRWSFGAKVLPRGVLCVKLRRMARLACGGGRIEDWHADAYRPMSSRVFPSTECQMIRSHGTAQRPWMAISLKKEIGIWRCHQILLLLTFIKDIIWYNIVANQSIYNYTYHAMKQNYMPCNESE